MKRVCPCGARVSPWNYARHRRGDACSARPIVVPHAGTLDAAVHGPHRLEYCGGCGHAWPCDPCTVGALAREGTAVELIAARLGVSVAKVRRDLRFFERMKRGGRPKRVRRKA